MAGVRRRRSQVHISVKSTMSRSQTSMSSKFTSVSLTRAVRFLFSQWIPPQNYRIADRKPQAILVYLFQLPQIAVKIWVNMSWGKAPSKKDQAHAHSNHCMLTIFDIPPHATL